VPAGVVVIEPVPSAIELVENISFSLDCWNRAVTVVLAARVTAQLAPEHAPDQPPNSMPASGVGESVSAVPR